MPYTPPSRYACHLPQGELTEGQEKVAWAINKGRQERGAKALHLGFDLIDRLRPTPLRHPLDDTSP